MGNLDNIEDENHFNFLQETEPNIFFNSSTLLSTTTKTLLSTIANTISTTIQTTTTKNNTETTTDLPMSTNNFKIKEIFTNNFTVQTFTTPISMIQETGNKTEVTISSILTDITKNNNKTTTETSFVTDLMQNNTIEEIIPRNATTIIDAISTTAENIITTINDSVVATSTITSKTEKSEHDGHTNFMANNFVIGLVAFLIVLLLILMIIFVIYKRIKCIAKRNQQYCVTDLKDVTGCRGSGFHSGNVTSTKP